MSAIANISKQGNQGEFLLPLDPQYPDSSVSKSPVPWICDLWFLMDPDSLGVRDDHHPPEAQSRAAAAASTERSFSGKAW